MGIEKAGLQLGKEIIAWARNGKSLLATRPVKINTTGLKLGPQLESDVVQISKQANRWTKNPAEYIPDNNIPNSHIQSHGKVEAFNRRIRNDINSLRDGNIIDDELDTGYRIIQIDKEFAKLTPLEKDCIGYRGIGCSKDKTIAPFDIIAKAKVGDIVKLDEGYTYVFQREAGLFDSCFAPSKPNHMLQIIRIPKGARVSRGGFNNEATLAMQHSSEFLMPRGAEYKLVSKEVDPYNGYQKVVLEYILPKSKYPSDIEQIKKVALQHVNSKDKFYRKYARKILEEMQNM